MLWLWLLASPKLIVGAVLSGLWWTPSTSPTSSLPTLQIPAAPPQYPEVPFSNPPLPAPVVAQQPSVQQPSTQQASIQQTSAQQPSAQQPSAQQPSAQQLSAQQLSAQQLSAQQLSAQQSSAQQPSAQQSSAQQSLAQQPSAHQPSVQETSAQQPSAEQSSAQQPSAQQPSAQQPSAQQSSAQHPLARKPAAQQPSETYSPTGKGAKRQLVVVMLDGSRWDYLELMTEKEMGGFRFFKDGGVRVEYVESVFPSVTYPAWTTLGTGLHPESHDVLGNSMYDRETRLEFNASSTQLPIWWQEAEPIWVTVTLQGLRAATIEWNRADVPYKGVLPEVAKGYTNSKRDFADRMEEVIWRLRQGFDLVMMYYEKIDTMGHHYGPAADEVFRELRVVGRGFDRLFKFATRGEGEAGDVHVLVVSDHGMAHACALPPLNVSRYADVRDDAEKVVCEGASAAIYAKPGRQRKLLEQLKDAPGYVTRLREDIPLEFHYKEAHRAPDLLMFGLPVAWNESACPMRGGVHGFDPTRVPDMRSLFLGWGSAFAGPGLVHPPLRLVDIYQLYAYLLRATPRPHNGSWDAVRGMLSIDAKALPPRGGGEGGGDVVGAGRGAESTQVKLKAEDGNLFLQTSQTHNKERISSDPALLLRDKSPSSGAENANKMRNNELKNVYDQDNKNSKYVGNYNSSEDREAAHLSRLNTANTQKQMVEGINHIRQTEKSSNYVIMPSSSLHEDMNLKNVHSYASGKNFGNDSQIKNIQNSTENNIHTSNKKKLFSKAYITSKLKNIKIESADIKSGNPVNSNQLNQNREYKNYATTIQNENKNDNICKYSRSTDVNEYLPENNLINLETRNKGVVKNYFDFSSINRRIRDIKFTSARSDSFENSVTKDISMKKHKKVCDMTPTHPHTVDKHLHQYKANTIDTDKIALNDKNMVCNESPDIRDKTKQVVYRNNVAAELPHTKYCTLTPTYITSRSENCPTVAKPIGVENMILKNVPTTLTDGIIRRLSEEKSGVEYTLNSNPTTQESHHRDPPAKLDDETVKYIYTDIAGISMPKISSSNEFDLILQRTSDKLTGFQKPNVYDGSNIVGAFHPSADRKRSMVDNGYEAESDQSSLNVKSSSSQAVSDQDVSSYLHNTPPTQSVTGEVSTKANTFDATTGFSVSTNDGNKPRTFEAETNGDDVDMDHSRFSLTTSLSTLNSFNDLSTDQSTMTSKTCIDSSSNMGMTSGKSDAFSATDQSSDISTFSEAKINLNSRDKDCEKYKTSVFDVNSHTGASSVSSTETTGAGIKQSTENCPTSSELKDSDKSGADESLVHLPHIRIRSFKDSEHVSQYLNKGEQSTESNVSNELKKEKLSSVEYESMTPSLVATKENLELTHSGSVFESSVTHNLKLDTKHFGEYNSVLKNDSLFSENTNIIGLKLLSDTEKKHTHFYPRTRAITTATGSNNNLFSSKSGYDNKPTYFQLLSTKNINQINPKTLVHGDLKHEKYRREAHSLLSHLRVTQRLGSALDLGRPQHYVGNANDISSRKDQRLLSDIETQDNRHDASTKKNRNYPDSKLMKEALQRRRLLITASPTIFGGEKIIDLKSRLEEFERETQSTREFRSTSLINEMTEDLTKTDVFNDKFKNSIYAQYVPLNEKDNKYAESDDTSEVEKENHRSRKTMIKDINWNKHDTKKQANKKDTYFKKVSDPDIDSHLRYDSANSVNKDATPKKGESRNEIPQQGKIEEMVRKSEVSRENEENKYFSLEPSHDQHNYRSYEVEDTSSNQEDILTTIKEATSPRDKFVKNDVGIENVKLYSYTPSLFNRDNTDFDTEKTLYRERNLGNATENDKRQLYRIKSKLGPHLSFSEKEDDLDSEITDGGDDVRRTHRRRTTERVLLRERIQSRTSTNPEDFSSFRENMQIPVCELSNEKSKYGSTIPIAKRRVENWMEFPEGQSTNQYKPLLHEKYQNLDDNTIVGGLSSMISEKREVINSAANSNTKRGENSKYFKQLNKQITKLTSNVDRGDQNELASVTPLHTELSIHNTEKQETVTGASPLKENYISENSKYISENSFLQYHENTDKRTNVVMKDYTSAYAKSSDQKDEYTRKVREYPLHMNNKCATGSTFTEALKKLLAEEKVVKAGLSRKLHGLFRSECRNKVNSKSDRQQQNACLHKYGYVNETPTSKSGNLHYIYASTPVYIPKLSNSNIHEQRMSLDALVRENIVGNVVNRNQKQLANNSSRDIDTNLLKLHDLMSKMSGRDGLHTNEKNGKRGERITKSYKGKENCKHSKTNKEYNCKSKNHHATRENTYRKKCNHITSNERNPNNHRESSIKYSTYADMCRNKAYRIQHERRKGSEGKLTTHWVYFHPKQKHVQHKTKQEGLEFVSYDNRVENEFSKFGGKNENPQKFAIAVDDDRDNNDDNDGSNSNNSPDGIVIEITSPRSSNVDGKSSDRQFPKVTEVYSKQCRSNKGTTENIDSHNEMFDTKSNKASRTPNTKNLYSLAKEIDGDDVALAITINFFDGEENKINSGNNEFFKETQNTRKTFKEHSNLENHVPSSELKLSTLGKTTPSALDYKRITEHGGELNLLIQIKDTDETKLSHEKVLGFNDMKSNIRQRKHIKKTKDLTSNSSVISSDGLSLQKDLEKNPRKIRTERLKQRDVPLQKRRKRSLSRNVRAENSAISPDGIEFNTLRSNISENVPNPQNGNSNLHCSNVTFHETSHLTTVKQSPKLNDEKNPGHGQHNYSLMNNRLTQRHTVIGSQKKFPCVTYSRTVKLIKREKRNLPNLKDDSKNSFKSKSALRLNDLMQLVNSNKHSIENSDGNVSGRQNKISEIQPIIQGSDSSRFLEELDPEIRESNSEKFHLYAPDEQGEYLGANTGGSHSLNLPPPLLKTFKCDVVQSSKNPIRSGSVVEGSSNVFHLKRSLHPLFPVTPHSQWVHQFKKSRTEQQKTFQPEVKQLQSKQSKHRPAALLAQGGVPGASTHRTPISSEEQLLQLTQSSIQLGSAGYLRAPRERQAYLEERLTFTRAWERYFSGVREERMARRSRAALARAARTPGGMGYAPIHPAAVRPHGSCM